MGNLFENAAKEATTAGSSKKTDKVVVTVTDPIVDKDLQKYAELDAQMKALEAQMAIVEGRLRPSCIEIFNEQYQKNGAYPESFNIVGKKTGAMILFVPSDRYTKPTDETFAELQKKYGTDVACQILEYTMDKDIINEYGEAISEAIEKSKKIPDDVKRKLIKVKKTLTIKKGTITKAFTLGKGLKGNVGLPEFIEDVKPVFSLKNATK